MGHGHDHEHGHGPVADRAHCPAPAAECLGAGEMMVRRRRERSGLLIALAITFVIFLAELAGGWISGSLALQADAGHMFADVVALGIALLGIAIAARPSDARRTWGYYRLEILSALANGILLTVVAIVIVVEAWERLFAPSEIGLSTMLGVASLGLFGNLVSIALLARHRGSMVTKGALLHALSDGVASVGVIAGALIMIATGWWWVDAGLSIAIALLIVVNAWNLVREAVGVLLEGIPLGFEIENVRSALAGIPGVRDVHDVHLWTITSGMFAFSCHVAVDEGTPDAARDDILTSAKTVLHDRFGIDHSTIQIEGPSWQEIGMVH